MTSQSIVYKIAAIIQTTSIVAGALLMLLTVACEKLNLPQPLAASGLLVGLCFFLIAASSAVKTFSQR